MSKRVSYFVVYGHVCVNVDVFTQRHRNDVTRWPKRSAATACNFAYRVDIILLYYYYIPTPRRRCTLSYLYNILYPCHYNNTTCAARDLKKIHPVRRRDIIIIIIIILYQRYYTTGYNIMGIARRCFRDVTCTIIIERESPEICKLRMCIVSIVHIGIRRSI